MQTKGLKLNIVREGGQAARAGLLAGDVLLTYNGKPLDSADVLTAARSSATSADEVGYLRAGLVQKAVVQPGTLDVSFAEVVVDIDPADQLAADMVVTTAQSVDGYKATRQLGLVTAECVFGLNVFKDFFTSVTDVVGGRSNTAQQALREARESCLLELKREAAQRGANAVIAVDLDYSEFSGGSRSMLFLVASGTAVFIEPA
jgi:uncharacterized protein YbjQ (UPF0145 family)